MRVRLLSALAAAAVLLAAGCGQSTKDRYIDDYSPLNDRLLTANDRLVRAINTAPGKSPTELATELKPLSGEMSRLSRQIAGLDTPEDLRQESAALARDLDRTGRGAGRTASAAKRRDRHAMAVATLDLAHSVNRVSRAADRLARATGATG
jgi:hypothetical protein